jgi:hypothetical protein
MFMRWRGEGGSLGFRDEGKLLHHVIISYMTRCLTLNRKFTGCMMILDNTPGSESVCARWLARVIKTNFLMPANALCYYERAALPMEVKNTRLS